MKILISFLFISIMLLLSCCASTKYNYYNKPTLTDSYTLIHIDTTPNYFVLNAVSDTNQDSVLIVVEKTSKQIKNKLAVNKAIVLKTYSFFDVVAIGNYCHDVENKRIWCFMDGKKDLRFTESMGNEIFIND